MHSPHGRIIRASIRYDGRDEFRITEEGSDVQILNKLITFHILNKDIVIKDSLGNISKFTFKYMLDGDIGGTNIAEAEPRMRLHWVDLDQADDKVEAFILFIHSGEQEIEYIIDPRGQVIHKENFNKSDYHWDGFI